MIYVSQLHIFCKIKYSSHTFNFGKNNVKKRKGFPPYFSKIQIFFHFHKGYDLSLRLNTRIVVRQLSIFWKK